MCCFRWCGRQLCLHNMPISGVNSTPRPTAVYASDPALPRRPQDSLPSCLLGFGRTRLSLASSFQLSYRTPHPALGQDVTLSRATPTAASEHSLELIGFPISRSFTTYCACLELRSLPSTGATRLLRTTNLSATPRRPTCPSRASGWSSLTTPWGFPCCVRFPCVHAAANTPVQQLGVSFAHLTQLFQPSPIWQSGRPTHRPFRGLLSVHSRCGLHTRAVTNS